jgi:hypothetical protein
MTSNPEPIVQQVPHAFQHLRTSVTGADARSQTAYTVELTVFRRWLALGATRLRLFFVRRAAGRPAEPVPAPEGTHLPDHDQRPTPDASVFGQVSCARPCLTAPGQQGLCPLDAELSWPARGSSDRRREWAVDGTTDESYRERQTVRERLLGLSLSGQALETCVPPAGGDGPPCSEQPADPTAAVPTGTLLVVHADGKGVPMVHPPTPRPRVRLGTGQKRGQQQEAVVTGLDTGAPDPRTPPEVGGALLQEPGRPEPAARPQPEGKARRAPLAGQAVARRRLAPRVVQHAGPHRQQRVTLTEGAAALQPPLVSHLPQHTLVLEISHATE